MERPKRVVASSSRNVKKQGPSGPLLVMVWGVFMRSVSHLIFLGVWVVFLGFVTTPLASATQDRIPDDVAAQETETCMKQAPKDPAWFGSVYCPCVMQQTQNKISYTDYQAVTKELTSGNPTAPRPAFENNKGAMESIARTCMVLVQKRALKEKSLAGDGDASPLR